MQECLHFPKTTLKEVSEVKFEEITIEEVRAGTTALSDQSNNPIEGGFKVSFYREGKKVGSIIGIMTPMEENQKIPPFTVDFINFSK